MKGVYIFLSTCCLLANALAKPAVFLGYQDSLGQYSFGYSAPGSARSEVRTSNGATRGAYSYVDGRGVIQSAQYVADGENGFRVVATNLPQAPLPVQDTEEVIAARKAHLEAVEQARKEIASENKGKDVEEGKPVERQTKEKIEQPIEEKIEVKSVEISKPAQNAADVESSKEAVEVSAAKVAQDVFAARPIAALPVIQSHVLLPHLLRQPGLPVFRVSQGSHEIEPSSIADSLNAQSPSNTPAGTALKTEEKIQTKDAVGPAAEKSQEKIEEAIISPINVIPLSSAYSSVIRYAPSALHYVAYNVL